MNAGQHSPESDQIDRPYMREMCAIDGDWGGTEWGEAILELLDLLEAVERDRDGWKEQVVCVRGQQRAALHEADELRGKVRRALDLLRRAELQDEYSVSCIFAGDHWKTPVAQAALRDVLFPPGQRTDEDRA